MENQAFEPPLYLGSNFLLIKCFDVVIGISIPFFFEKEINLFAYAWIKKHKISFFVGCKVFFTACHKERYRIE